MRTASAGRRPDFRVADFVYDDASERAELPDVLSRAVSAISAVIEKGFAAAQNTVNTRK